MSETTLIIPDIHLKVNLVDRIIASVKHDKVICLGDVFDDFGDTADLIREAAKWLNKFVDNPNHIMCWGNHDQHYGFPYRSFQCSGYEDWKYFCIRDTIKSSTWDKVKWYHFLDNRWMLSHGGLHKLNVPKDILELRSNRPKFIATISEFLDKSIRIGLQHGSQGESSWIFNAGAGRGGNQQVGGITWCDFEREFFPVLGINQIVGHTAQAMGGVRWTFIRNKGNVEYRYNTEKPFFKPEELDDPEKSFNVDLDVHKDMHYATWNGKELKIERLSDMYKQ